jgi:hypothetical protein
LRSPRGTLIRKLPYIKKKNTTTTTTTMIYRETSACLVGDRVDHTGLGAPPVHARQRGMSTATTYIALDDHAACSTSETRTRERRERKWKEQKKHLRQPHSYTATTTTTLSTSSIPPA